MPMRLPGIAQAAAALCISSRSMSMSVVVGKSCGSRGASAARRRCAHAPPRASRSARGSPISERAAEILDACRRSAAPRARPCGAPWRARPRPGRSLAPKLWPAPEVAAPVILDVDADHLRTRRRGCRAPRRRRRRIGRPSSLRPLRPCASRRAACRCRWWSSRGASAARRRCAHAPMSARPKSRRSARGAPWRARPRPGRSLAPGCGRRRTPLRP